MTEEKKQKKSRALARIETLLEKKREEERLIREGRYHEIDPDETEQERDQRIMDSPAAWS